MRTNFIASLRHFLRPDIAAKQFQKEIEAQKHSMNILKAEYLALNSWHTQYVSTLSILTESMDALVWKKDKNHKYILANPVYCSSFFGFDATPQCLKEIVGKSDEYLINSAYKGSGINNSFEDICGLSDEYVTATKKTIHFFEAGAVGNEELLFYIVKTPQYDAEGAFIGTVGMAWDLTDNSEFLLSQMTRWIYSNKVKKLYKKQNVFSYAILPEVKKCEIFKHVCPYPERGKVCSDTCNMCSDDEGD